MQNDFKKFEVGDNILLVNEEWGLSCRQSYFTLFDNFDQLHVLVHTPTRACMYISIIKFCFLCFVIKFQKFNSVYNKAQDTSQRKIILL